MAFFLKENTSQYFLLLLLFLLSNILYRLIIIIVRIEYDQTNRMFDLKYFHTNTYLELFLFPLSFTISVLSNKSKEAVSSIQS